MSLSSLQLDAFLTLAQNGNFSVAAGKLNITQSALSQRIQNLEDELESTLFVRDPKKLTLTPLGHELLRYCQSKAALEEEFLKKQKVSANELVGTARIAGFSTVVRSVILPALRNIALENSKLQFEFLTKEIRDLFPALEKGETDFIVTNEKLQRQGIEVHFLGFEVNVLVRSKNQKTTSDLFLDHDYEDATTNTFLQSQVKKIEKLRRSYFDEIYTIIDGVALGYGRAVVPAHLVNANKELEIVPEFRPLKTPVYLSYFTKSYYPALHQKIIDVLKKESVKFLLGK